MNKPKFPLGNCSPLPAALKAMEESGQSPGFFLEKHVQGDWGEVCDEDKRANDQALVDGCRLLVRLQDPQGGARSGSSPRRRTTRAGAPRPQF